MKRQIRPLISIIIGLAILLSMLTACSNSAKTSDNSVKAKPAKGGTFTFALATSPDSLDPQVSGMAVSQRVNRNIYDNLVYQTKSGEFKPWLATKWTISKDRKSYTFTLRKDVTFQDGTKFNAEAVKYTFDRILDPKTKAGPNTHAAILNYKSADVINDYKIRINLTKPSEPFLNNVSQSNLEIVSPTAAKKYGDQFSTHPVGTGPYKFVKLIENDQIELVRNNKYKWGPPVADNKGPGYVDKLIFKIIPEESTRIGSVESGQVDAAETVPPQNVVSIKKSHSLKLFEYWTTGMPFVFFINQSQAPWNTLKARQAVQAGIDVNTIVKTLYLGTYKRAWSAITPGLLGYDKSLENKDFYNPKKANQLLDELGWKKSSDGFRQKDGKELTFHLVDLAVNREKRHDIDLMVKQQLKKIGINVTIQTSEQGYVLTQNKKAYDVFGNSIVSGDPDVINKFFHSGKEPEKGGSNIGRVHDKEIDKWLDQAYEESNQEKRAQLYEKVQKRLSDQAAIIPIYVYPNIIAATQSVQGLKFDSEGYPLFYDVSVKK